MTRQSITVPSLNDLEWQAVSAALNGASTCGCSGIVKPTVVGKVLRTIFHVKPAEPLADPKLEAVRRLVCETRQRTGHADVHEAALAAHGYNNSQIAALALLSESL